MAAIRRDGGEAHALAADLGDREAVYPLVGAATALVGPIDVLVQNASTLGAVPLRELADTECEDLARVLEVNLVGPFRLTKAVVGSMVLRGEGTVVGRDLRRGGERVPDAGVRTASRRRRSTTCSARGRPSWPAPAWASWPSTRARWTPRMHADAMPDATARRSRRPRGRGPTDRVAPRIRRVGERREGRGGGPRHRGVSALAAATWPDRDVSAVRLMHVDPERGVLADRSIGDLPRILRAGDLVVVNDAATLPASLPGLSSRGPVELRLAGAPRDPDGTRWDAVLFGPGSWRDRTEERLPPPPLPPGETIEIEPGGPGRGLRARVVGVSPLSPRLVVVEFDRRGAALWSALFRVGRPVQYSYTRAILPLWHVQTAFAGRPFAAEMPSAGRPLRLPLLRALRARGVGVCAVTHAAGLSSTGDPALDAALPFPEALHRAAGDRARHRTHARVGRPCRGRRDERRARARGSRVGEPGFARAQGCASSA